MGPVLGFVILIATLRLLLATEKPFLCAATYTFVWFLLLLFFGNPLVAVLIDSAITLAYMSGYFWLLVRFMGQGALYWLTLIAGLVLPWVVRFLLIWRASA